MIGRQGSPDLIQKMHDLTLSLQWQKAYIEDRSTQAKLRDHYRLLHDLGTKEKRSCFIDSIILYLGPHDLS